MAIDIIIIDIILVFLVISLIFALCALIFLLYICSLPPKKQDEVWDNLQNKFNNFWK